ncbi:hypothetical protein [Parachitinimonas caeni]|uniref:Uncharacterized protein n=1 Tax=Parachitinimonas caeni TaxID=3031301 RepID=A0ABT7E3T1_9NEIS|nr:hypothetical protein [Parachitinimonas caeni]MDK2126979.1 hypothetical protein [Parachitinimonas caeni]
MIRLAVAGKARFQDYPDKNQASHPHDALQYVCLGLTEPVAPPAPPTKPSWRETLQPQRQRSGMRA